MPEFTPVEAFMKGAKEAKRYYNYKCNNPDEDDEPTGGLQRQPVYLRKHNNRSDLNSSADSWYLNYATEGDEAEEYYYICNFKFGGHGKGTKYSMLPKATKPKNITTSVISHLAVTGKERNKV